MSKITIKLTDNQAIHLWGILASYVHDTTNDLKRRGTFKKDGTPNQRQKYYGEIEQEKIDNITVAKLVYEHIEKSTDVSAGIGGDKDG